jgi:hypothetical protein
MLAGKLARYFQSHQQTYDLGDFPIAYTELHDLSLDFLIRKAVTYQKQDLAEIERCVANLAGHPEEQSLAEEALGASRAHLEMLEDLVRQPA